MEKNILLTIEYDGSEFSGWQKQPDRPTVQGYLEKVLSDLLKREIALSGTSRTDAGVHARGQKASFRTDINIPTERLALVINNILCGHEKGAFALSPVKIVSAEERPLDFQNKKFQRNRYFYEKLYVSCGRTFGYGCHENGCRLYSRYS